MQHTNQSTPYKWRTNPSQLWRYFTVLSQYAVKTTCQILKVCLKTAPLASTYISEVKAVGGVLASIGKISAECDVVLKFSTTHLTQSFHS